MKAVLICIRCGVKITADEWDRNLRTCTINGSKPTTHIAQQRIART